MDRISVKRNLVNGMGLDFDKYKLTGSSKEERELVKNIKRRLKKKLLPRLNIFDDFKILFESGKYQILGLYICGSYSWKPTFCLCLDNIDRYANEYDVNYETVMETTILHELAHAIQEYQGLESDEEEAEEFAYNYFTYGRISKFWKKGKVVC